MSDTDTGLGAPEPQEEDDFDSRPTTTPKFTITFHGATEDHAVSLGGAVSSWIRAIGKVYDLSGLDGVTISNDYAASLRELDRGYETKFVLEPTTEHALGVAMSPTVKRDGQIKTHLVFDALFMNPLLDETDTGHQVAIQTLAHECAHVEVTRATDLAFPGTLLHPSEELLANLRWQVIRACWDEYKVCSLAGAIGHDPTDGYASTLLTVLKATPSKAQECLERFWSEPAPREYGRVGCEVFGAAGNLLKFASYFLGALAGTGRSISDFPELAAALDGEENWFVQYLDALKLCLEEIDADYARWPDKAAFERLGDLAEFFTLTLGVGFSTDATGQLMVHPRFL